MEHTISPKEMLDHLKEMSEFADHFQRVLKNTAKLEEKAEDKKEKPNYRADDTVVYYPKLKGRFFVNDEEYIKKDQPNQSNQWRCAIEDHPEDDQTILVSWKDGNDNWCGYIQAYYSEKDEEYYALDVLPLIPINCTIWHPLPKFPGE
jgi:hypothetical protein